MTKGGGCAGVPREGAGAGVSLRFFGSEVAGSGFRSENKLDDFRGSVGLLAAGG